MRLMPAVPTEDVPQLLADLASPLHGVCLRDPHRKPASQREAGLDGGYDLIFRDPSATAGLHAALDDFHRFMSICMDVPRRTEGFAIELSIGTPRDCPAEAPEAFHVSVSSTGAEVVAQDHEGLRRAIFWLEDEMALRRGPYLPLGRVSRWAVIVDRIAHSPCASGRNLTGWELEDDRDYYPDEYLNKLVHCGMSGIWVAGLLRRLVNSQVIPELGPKSHRLTKLKELVRRAGAYGLRVYLLGIEPRGLPNDHPAFAAHPQIKGAKFCEVTSALCTSTPLVRQYIREVMGRLFTEVPQLGGFINLYNGERGTTCWLTEDFVKTCPRCRKRSQGEVLAEDLNQFHAGICSVSKTGKLLAWAYTMNTSDSMTAGPTEPVVQTIARAHPDIIWLGNFEHGGSKKVAGKKLDVHEYSLSYAGPSEAFQSIAAAAARRGARPYAKLQIGTTYEMPSLPYVAVPGIVYDKFAAMHRQGVRGCMVNWIIGGYPSLMLKAAGEASFAPLPRKTPFLSRLAGLYADHADVTNQVRAWKDWGRIYQSYPNNNHVLYFGPITRSPAYHLQLQPEPRRSAPYNYGWNSDRQAQPFEDQPAHWTGELTAPELVRVFRQMGRNWLAVLNRMNAHAGSKTLSQRRQHAVTQATGIQLLSTANVYEFYLLREQAFIRNGPRLRQTLERMKQLVLDDIALARDMKRQCRIEPFIGFHSEMLAYSYSVEQLDSKLTQCRAAIRQLNKWIKTGQPPKTMAIEIIPPGKAVKPTYRNWLQHGD
ncbi:MAG: hypothetical protein IT440_12130 [Phycisphaeraceae bacterium]|nr:hypothetical protein [Phycisphaeraceae bacterium]